MTTIKQLSQDAKANGQSEFTVTVYSRQEYVKVCDEIFELNFVKRHDALPNKKRDEFRFGFDITVDMASSDTVEFKKLVDSIDSMGV